MTAEFFLSRFTPSMMSAEVLEKVFVQRGDMADRIVDVLRESVITPAKHHTLVIGSRGIGKTHLLSLIQNRIAQQADLAEQVRIAWLREEEWGVASFLDFLYRILRALAARYQDEELQEHTEQLFSISLKTAERRAADLLRGFIKGKTLLLIAENLDSVFAGLGKKGQQRLRAYLQEESSWTILGSSQALFGGVTLYDSPFYGFFDIHHLQELTVDDAARLVRNIAELANNTELAAYVESDPGRARIRAVHHLAGGNHRVYMILSEFLTRDSLDQLVEPFLRMMDDLTPYYQARMEQLSPQQRKIIDLLCSVRGAVPVREIAKRCFISSQTASSQLKDLRDRGYVESTPVGRDAYYELAEPLMRLALEVKNQRNGHIRLFLDFLRHWYARAELVNLLARTAAESVLEREYLQSVLAEESDAAGDPDIQRIMVEADALSQKGDWERALPLAERLVHQRGASSDWTLLGTCMAWSGNYTEALAVLDRALDLDDTNIEAWMFRSLTLLCLTREDDALDSVLKAINIDSTSARAHALRGVVLTETGRLDEALASYDRSLELSSEVAPVWAQRSKLLARMERYEDALESLDSALALDPTSELEVERGMLLNRLGEYEKAVVVFDRVLLNSRSLVRALHGRAFALLSLGRDDLALMDAEEAHALAPDHVATVWLMGRQLVRLRKYSAAIPFLNDTERLGTPQALWLESRVRALFGTHRLEEGKVSLGQWLASINEGEQLIGTTVHVLSDIFTDLIRFPASLQPRESALALWDTYHRYQFSGTLNSSLVEFAEVLAHPDISTAYVRAWVTLWSDVVGYEPELGLALRLSNAVYDYRETGDPRILLNLPLEERRIIEQVLENSGHLDGGVLRQTLSAIPEDTPPVS